MSGAGDPIDADLAAKLEGLSPEEKRTLLSRLLARRAAAEAETTTRFPLSSAQQRLWFIERLSPGQLAYVIPTALDLVGRLDVPALEAALTKTVARHEILRTRFVQPQDGEPFQAVDPEGPVPIERVTLPRGEPDEQVRAHLADLLSEPFDLEHGPLFRTRLLALPHAPEDGEPLHVLLFAIHHIVADYASLRILIGEIAAHYAFGRTTDEDDPGAHGPALPEPAIQYADYAVWQREQDWAAGLDWWAEALDGMPSLLNLPTDFPRPARRRYTGARHVFRFSPALSEKLRRRAKAERVSLYALLLAGFQALLFRYSGQTDFAIGTTASNRDRSELGALIGLFVNNLVLRARVEADLPFAALLERAQQTTQDAIAHQDVPFEQIVERLDPDRQLSHNALFQTMFVLHNTSHERVDLPALSLRAREIEAGSARFDLGLDMVEFEGTLEGFFEYSTELFTASTAARFADHFERLLEAVALDPKQSIAEVVLFDAQDARRVRETNATAAPLPDEAAHRAFERVADASPARVALQFGEARLDYAELDRRANRVAHWLAAHGVRPGERVGLCLPRSVDLVVALLAVLKAGAHYVPLDPSHPNARLARIARHAGLRHVFCAPNAPDWLPDDCVRLTPASERSAIEAQPATRPVIDPTGEDLAYLIYTSGSTGEPKGVPIRHRSLVNLLASMARTPGLEADDALLAVTTIAFDIATLELLLPLCVGARLVLAEAATTLDGAALAFAIERERVTAMQATPATWRLLLEGGWAPSARFKILCGGEALDVALARRLLATGAELWNLYGPTETTIWSGALRLDETLVADGLVPIGGPIANTGFHVLEASGAPAPQGVTGELWISGEGLSPGYHAAADLTADRFVDAADEEGRSVRLYRTGDLVSRRADGRLQFRGRVDDQVKLRGFRIELGEIESALVDHASIGAAVVRLEGETRAQERLTAWCETGGASVDVADLRAHLDGRLPRYMVPSRFVLMDALPLTPNGKIDRKALPASDEDASTAPGRAPSTVTETTLLSLWSELLGRPIADVDADFFAVGGHSLLAARLAARIEGTFGTTVPVGDLFEEPTVAAFAASLDARLADAPPALAKLRPRDADAVPRLSYAQYRQWALARLDPENAAYHIPAAIRLNRPIAPDVLEHALAFVIARHEVLRAGFVDEEGVPRVLLESTPAPSVRHVPLPDAEAKRDEADVLALLRDDVTRPFDLARPPLLRATIVDVGEDEQVVLLVLHHIVGDAWSLRILFTELMQICRRAALGLAPKLPAPPLGYFDFAAWEHERDDEASLAYWREQLRDLPPVLDLPLDRPRPQIQDTTAGEVRFALSAHARARLESTCRAQGATLFMGLLAGWNALLHRWSGVDDVTIGCPIGHRPHADLDEVVGLFVNTLAIRTRIRPEASFASLVGDVRETVLDGMAHQDAPFDQVVGELELPRSFAHAPVFQVLFVWQETEADANPATRGAWSPLPLPVASTKVDLTLAMSPDADGGLRARIEFRRDLFHAKTLERLASAFVALLEGAAEAPETPIEALSTQSHAGREELARWNPRYVPVVREGGMLGPFEARAARTPDATALIAPDATLSYGELDARANALAHRLEAAGIGRGQRVGVCMQRTSTLIVAILGALKAGATYVPLDPDYPRERMEYVIRDAELAAFIGEPDRIPTDVAASAAAPLAIDGARLDAVRAERVETDVAPDDLAYIIYTSGSTGQPKGVAIEHASALALVDWAEAEYPAERLAGVLAGTSVCFDLSIFEIFVPLSLGGTIVLAENALALPELAARDRVTLVNTVPTAAAELVRSEGIPPGVTTINVAGEPLTSELVRALYDRPGVDRVYNLYGPSEDTTYSTGALLDYDEEAAFAVIGRPLPNTQAFVLDERFEPVAPGFVGDLFLAGDGVARGYWNRPGLTAERFLPTPFVDAEASSPRLGRMYATGDRVRLRHDGELLFLGRTDNQVKVRGFRIELGEIEATLARHPQVASAALRVHEYEGTGAARKRLVAYVTVEGEANGRVSGGALPPSDPFAETLRTHVGQSLPHYMMPATIVVLDALPQLPNGKVDYRALERPALPRDEGLPEAETRTATEAMLAELWQTVLGVDVVGRHDNFFMLGGDSIVALQLVARVRQRGFGMMPRDLFTSPSVAELAATLDAKAEDAVLASAQIEEGVVPLTPIQHWFFSLPLDHAAHWNQGVLLEVDRPIEATALEAALGALAERHDALRSTFRRDESGWQREIARPGGPVPVTQVRATSDDVEAVIQTKAAEIQARFDLTQGPLWEVASFVLTPTGGGATVRRLLVLCHHLLVDGVSWRILLGDLQLALVQQAEGRPIELAPPSTPASTWAAFLEDWEAGAEDEAHWAALARRAPPPLPRDPEEQAKATLPRDAEEHATAPLPGDAEEQATAPRATHDNALRDGAIHSLTFDAETTDQLLRALPKAYAADLETLALAALARALHAWHGRATVPVLMEGHGRVDLDPGIDLSRTVGWLTSLHPVEIEVDATDPGRALKLVKSATKSIAHQGLGYTRRHFLGEPFAPAPHELAEVRFNYLGQTDQVFAPGTWFAPAPEAIGALRHPEDPRDAVLDVNAIVRRGCLVIHLGYGRHLHRRETIEALGSRLREELLALLAYCLGDEHDGGYVEADFPQMEFAPGELDDLLDALD